MKIKNEQLQLTGQAPCHSPRPKSELKNPRCHSWFSPRLQFGAWSFSGAWMWEFGAFLSRGTFWYQTLPLNPFPSRHIIPPKTKSHEPFVNFVPPCKGSGVLFSCLHFLSSNPCPPSNNLPRPARASKSE